MFAGRLFLLVAYAAVALSSVTSATSGNWEDDNVTSTRILGKPTTEGLEATFARPPRPGSTLAQDAEKSPDGEIFAPAVPAETNPPQATSPPAASSISAVPVTASTATSYLTPTGIPTPVPSPATAISHGPSLQVPDQETTKDPEPAPATNSPLDNPIVSPDPSQGGAYIPQGQPLTIGQILSRGNGEAVVLIAVHTPSTSGSAIEVVIKSGTSTFTTPLPTSVSAVTVLGQNASGQSATVVITAAVSSMTSNPSMTTSSSAQTPGLFSTSTRSTTSPRSGTVTSNASPTESDSSASTSHNKHGKDVCLGAGLAAFMYNLVI
ncbi:hypothetical protein BDZ85DRAFT_251563 [Elsinoe ampelina]|uniref:Uncharacterized protein n=1 Tax=Elsinoe ampelina TaxID=302913 RepID=A0A6A6G5R5_9PEZI|nr:hypothetical protein BDZ85DRAFT_251563 [Elsinoe ampelina]